jgi:UDP:flavonoid glycosyltransferase YjiC (YdhE family)
MLPLLGGLCSAGVQTTCFGHRAFEAVIRRTGASFEPYPEVDYDISAPDFGHAQMAADLINAAEIIRPALKPRVSDLKPRLIVQDFMALWASQIGTDLNIPRLHTVPTIVLSPTAQRMMRREDGVAKLLRDVVTGGPALLGAHLRSGFATTPKEAFALDGAWRKLQPPVGEIIFSIEEVQVGETKGSVRRHYIGPTIEPSRRFQPESDMGYALITFGTLSNTQTGRFEAAIRGTFEAGYSVVAQCGSKVDLNKLEKLGQSLMAAKPKQFVRIVNSVPDMEKLIVGAVVVIHHAGMATTWETVQFRKPALFIPTISDQKVFASQLERIGLGLRLAPGREYDVRAIKAGVEGARALPYDWDRIHALLAKAGGAPAGIMVVTSILDGAA